MEYEIEAKFIIMSKSHDMSTDNICIMKGILGSEHEITKEYSNKIDKNSITTLVIRKSKHKKTVNKIRTGCEISILGTLKILKNHHQHIHIKKIAILKKNLGR